MLFLIKVNNQQEYTSLMSLVFAASVGKVPTSTMPDGKVAHLAAELAPKVSAPSRVRVWNTTAYSCVEPRLPDGQMIRDYKARVTSNQNVTNNIYWYLRDATTQTNLTIIIADEKTYDALHHQLDDMVVSSKAKVQAWLKTADGKSAFTVAQRKEILNLDGYDYWCVSNLPPLFDMMKSLIKAIVRRSTVQSFADSARVHKIFYTVDDPVSISWAYFLGYMNPFTGVTREGKLEALSA